MTPFPFAHNQAILYYLSTYPVLLFNPKFYVMVDDSVLYPSIFFVEFLYALGVQSCVGNTPTQGNIAFILYIVKYLLN
jgi:hypothetical protein